MVKSEVVKKLAEELSVTQKKAEEMFEVLGKIYFEAVKKGESVPIPALGKVIVHRTKAREFYSNITKKNEQIASKLMLKIHTSQYLKSM